MPRKKKAAEEVYHVEVITKARVSDEGEWEYYVKWFGYDSDADSWEPSVNVQQCERLLTSFWKHVGMDDKDYELGTVIPAGDEWIEKEKQYFHDNFVKRPKRKSVAQQNEQDRRKLKSSTPPMSASSTNDSESSDEGPLAKSFVRSQRNPRVVDTDSEPDADDHSREPTKPMSRPKVTAHSPPPKEADKDSTQIKRPESTLTAGVSVSIAPPKVTAVRTHQDQRTNPLVKTMSLPSKSVEAASLLSTKQRVAAGIPPLPPPPKKAALSSLSFKKNKPALPFDTKSTKDVTTSKTSVATPTLPTVRNQNINNNAEVDTPSLVASPQPMDVDQPTDLWGSMSDDGIPVGSSDAPAAPIPPKSQEDIAAEKFLQTIHLPALHGPLAADVAHDGSALPTTDLNKSLTTSKIPKKWKWSGDLFISTSDSKTEQLCAVTIADSHGTSNTSHINLLLSSLDSLRISKLYSIMDLPPLFRACRPCQYYGALESVEPEDINLQGLEHHLNSERLAAVIPLHLNASEVAVLVVFPGTQQGLAKFLQVPDHLQPNALLVGLLPFAVPTMTSIKVAGWRSIETMLQSSARVQDVFRPYESSQKAMLYQAMSLLGFPKALLDFLNSPTARSYCIWPLPNQVSTGLDTTLLQYILESTLAVSAKLEEDVRVVFISNQHLKALHTIPTLASKLVDSPETQFWTYGYSAGMTCQCWQVQEVYPLGGIVTFTASALLEDLMGCYHLISKISEHPFWDCYLIPEVLALSHKLYENPSSETCLEPFLDSINLGLISVTRMPEMILSSHVTWLSKIFHQSSIGGAELLKGYLEVLGNQFTTSSMTNEQLISFTNNEIAKDLANVRVQPALMENYRRFVVIKAVSEGNIPLGQGLEWSTLSLFSFKDDYFQL